MAFRLKKELDQHTTYVDPHTGIENKDGRIAEAADIYGSIAEAEQLEYVTRGYVGVNLELGSFADVRVQSQVSSRSIHSPRWNYWYGSLLGYRQCLHTCWSSVRPFGLHFHRYCCVRHDAVSWRDGHLVTTARIYPAVLCLLCRRRARICCRLECMYPCFSWLSELKLIFQQNWYASSITLCAEISAASIVIQYWSGAQDISVAVWISIIIVLVICLNVFAVSIYGEAEFIFASVKIITIVGLLLMALIVDLGGNPRHDRLGFRFWKNPGAMKEYIGTGATGRFLGLFSVFVSAAFSYSGVELVAVAAGEAENPRKNIPKAVRRVFWRILFFHVLETLIIGVLVASNDRHLLAAQKADLLAQRARHGLSEFKMLAFKFSHPSSTQSS